jgi:hypothetical protein
MSSTACLGTIIDFLGADVKDRDVRQHVLGVAEILWPQIWGLPSRVRVYDD